METTVLVLLALTAAAVAGPIGQPDQCALECKGSDKFNYAPGTTYSYDYKVETTTSMSGASEDSAKLSLQASAEIEVLSQCEFALRLRNTRLFHSDENGRTKAADRERQFQNGLENSVVRFSFNDGVVDQVCPEDDEEPWTLNIKKGILSAFQNSMDDWRQDQNVTETDITGECTTEYSLVNDGYYTTSVKKVKDVLTCYHRHDFRSMYHHVPYRMDSEVQTLPIMKTSHECQQDIENKGLLKSTTCTETHVYRPFSHGQSGGATTIQQSLTYSGERRSIRTRQSTITNRDTLTFDHSTNEVNPRNARQKVELTLREICETTKEDLRPESPMIFSDLVSSLRTLEENDMEDLHRLLKTKTICPSNDRTYKFFTDALPSVGTSASVKLMTTLLTNEDVTGMQAKQWLMSLPFITSPTTQILKEVKPLLDNKITRYDAMLPMSSLINNFCRKMEACSQDSALVSLMTSLQDELSPSCDASGDKLEKILMTLRAIGNAGHVKSASWEVTQCLVLDSSPLEVKVAAAQAFRRMPCGAGTSELWNTFEDTRLDSELRIAAYLSLMRCPDDSTLEKLVKFLDKDDDEHVAAFVYSHLTNIRDSSNPHKQELARAIKSLALDKNFDLSILKSSRNFEASMLLNKINTGFTADSNVIWSSEAQLPRSFAANLTFELFGESVNLLDFGGRLEGLEYMIKSAFGPYLPDEKEWGKTTNDLDDVKGSMYGRMFGNEMFFKHTSGVVSPMSKMPASWLELLIDLSKQHDYAFTQSSQIMDVRMTIPSCVGLPLHVTVNGTATLDLKVNGKVDLRKVASKPRSLDVDGEIRPSGAMEITGSLAVDAFVTRTGVRMRNTLHSSTAMKGRVQLERGQQLNIEIDTPEDKIEVFDARSKFFIFHNNVEQEQDMIKDNRKQMKMCTGDNLATITGMEACGEIQFPNASMKAEGPYFPLTGPASLSFVLYKRDSHSGYKMFAKRVENKKHSIAQISFNTPGSKVNRAISLDMTLNYPRRELEVTMASPWKTAAIRGTAVDANDMKSLSGSLVIDETETYAMTAEVKMTKSKNKVDFSPMFELRRPGVDNIQLTGVVSVEEPLKGVTADLSLTGVDKLPYTLQGTMANTKKDKSVALTFSPNSKDEYSFKSLNTITPAGKKGLGLNSVLELTIPGKTLMSMVSSVDYREDKSLKTNTTIEVHKLLKKSSLITNSLKTERKNGVRYNTNVVVKSQKLSGRFQGQTFIKKAGLIASKMSLSYNIPKVAKNMIVMNTKFNDRSTKAYKKYTLKSNMEVKKSPQYNWGLTFGLDHKKKHSEVDAELKYGPNPKDKNKRFHLNAVVKKNIKNYKNAVLNYKMKAEAPEHKIDITMNGKHQHTPKLVDSNVQLNYAKGKNVKASVFLKDQSSKLMRVNGNMKVSWPGKEYTLTSKLTQVSGKQYTHAMTLKDNKGMKHDVSTVYKMPKAKSHTFISDLKLDGFKPIKVSGSTTLDPRNFEVSGDVVSGKDKYGFSTKGKIATKVPGAKVDVEVFYPDRRIVVLVDGGKDDNKMDGKIEVAWDADKRKKSKMTLDGSYVNKMSPTSTRIGGHLAFSSPFDKFENIGASLKYDSDKSQEDLSGKISWGGKAQELSGSLNVQKPLSLYNIQMLMKMKTPIKGMRVVDVEVSHKMEPSLITVLKGSADQENVQLTLSGENRGSSRGYQRDFKGSMSLKSTVENAEAVTVTVAHADNSRRFISNWVVVHNGKTYTYDMTMDHAMSGWQIQNNGDIVISTPDNKISTIWNHKNSDDDIKSSLTSKWGNERLYIDLKGAYGVGQYRKLDATLTIQSPWQSIKDTKFTLNHKNGFGLIENKVYMTELGRTKASSEINYRRGYSSADFDMKLVSPYHEDITAKINTLYENFPYTGSMELQWSPRHQATIQGSVIARAWNDFDLNTKVTTPIRGYRNILFKASNKNEGQDILAHVNLDYGIRQSIDLEGRFQPSLKLMRFKMNTPFSELKSLDTGYRYDEKRYGFSTQADFELHPYVGKIDGSLTMNYGNTFNSKLRIDTPFSEYRYFELSTSSEDKGRLRQSNIRLDYHPQQVFNLDTSYRFDLPLAFDASIQSPYPEFNDLSLAFQHEHSQYAIKTHGEVTYQPYKKIEGSLVADWSREVEGSLVVKTPFTNYEDNKISLKHLGDLTTFNSQGEVVVGGHNVMANVALKAGYLTTGSLTMTSSIPGVEKVTASFKKRGPLDNMRGNVMVELNDDKMESTFNHKWMERDMQSSFTFTSPYTKDLKFSFEHTGAITSFNSKMSMNYGRMYDIDTLAVFEYNAPDFSGNGMIKYKLGGRPDTLRMSFSKSGELDHMQFSGTGSYNRDAASVTGSWKVIPGLDANIEVKTPFGDFRNVGMTMFFNGNLDDIKANTKIDFTDNRSITGTVELAHGYGRRLKFMTEVTTPFSGFEKTNVQFNNVLNGMDISGDGALTTSIGSFGTGTFKYSRTGSLENLKVEAQVAKNRDSIMDLKLTNSKRPKTMYTELSFKSLVTEDLMTTVDLSGDMNDFTSKAKYSYGSDNIVTGEMTMKSTRSFMEVNGKVVYDLYRFGSNVVSMKAKQKGGIDDFSTDISGKYGPHAASMTAMFKNKDELAASVIFNTPFRGFHTVGGSFKHSGTLERFNTEAEVMLGDGQKYGSKVDFYRYELRRIETTIEVTTPISGYELTKVEYRHEGETNSFKCFATVEYGKSQIVYDMSASGYPKPEFKLSVTTPYKGYKNLLVFGTYTFKGPQYDVSGEINAGRGNIFNVKGQLDTTDDITGSLFVTTPFEGFTDLSSTFNHKGNDQKFDTDAQVTYMDGQQVSGKVSFYRYQWRRVVASAELATPFSGMESNKLTYQHEDRRNSLTSSATVEYGYNKKIDTTVKLTYSPDYDISITVKTPYYQYRKLTAQGTLDMTGPTYSVSYSGDFGRNTAHSANGKLNFYSWNNLNGFVEVKTPFQGMEFTKYEYSQKSDSTSFEETSTLTYANGQVVKSELKFIFSPNIEVTFALNTPFQGYEDIQAFVSYDNSFHKYNTVSRLDLGRGKVYSMTSGLDYSVEPLKVFTKIFTPHREHSQMELEVTHEGKLDDFRTTASFNCPTLGDVNAGVSFKYVSPFEMNALITLKSPMQDMDDIKVQLKTTDIAGEKKGYAEFQWTDAKEVTADVSFRQQEGWYETKMVTEVSINTPFEAVRSTALQMEYLDKQGTYSEKVKFSLNEAQLLDMDAEYSSKNDHQVDVTVREPWPMQFTGKASSGDQQSDLEIYLNWDRDEPESNVNLKATYKDMREEQSFDLGLVHPARSVGIKHTTMTTADKMSSSGQLYWNTDDASRLSYEMESTHTNRRGRTMTDGKLKLGFPARTLGLTGSYSESAVASYIDGAFSWDADRDMSKKIEVQANLAGDAQKKGDLTIRLPSFNKEIKIGGEMMFRNGRIIFDTKTDISYSPDSRKTLTLTSKLEDLTFSRGNYHNYSLELGVKHPYTRLDLQVVSHIGNSKEKMTMAVDTQYLTHERQMKNLALFGEINKLRNNINILMHNGESKFEVTGDMISTRPYKVKVMSMLDDERLLDSEITVDMDKKAVLLTHYYDTDGRLTVSAMYPNSTAFNVDVTHYTPVYDHQELLLGVRLNTSRLLHTRLTWRPEMIQELRAYLKSCAAEKGQKLRSWMRLVNEEVKSELAMKYVTIHSAFMEEMTPLLKQIRQEFQEVEYQLRILIQNFDRMYSRNDLYIQKWREMGIDVYGILREVLVNAVAEYSRKYTSTLDSIEDCLKESSNFPVRDYYDQMMTEAAARLERMTMVALQEVNVMLSKMDDMLIEIRYAMNYTNRYMDDLKSRIDQLTTMDLTPYKIDFTIPPLYTNAFNSTVNMVSGYVGPLLERPEIAYVRGGLNEVYQQGIWAYNYWQIEENMYRHLQSILHTLGEIIKAELDERMHMQSFSQNPEVIWNPENGFIQADFILPGPVKRLDEVPDLSPIMKRAESVMDKYMPDTKTLEYLYESAVEFFTPSAKQTKGDNQTAYDDDDDDDDDEDLRKQLKKYKPAKSKKWRKKGRKSRARVASQ